MRNASLDRCTSFERLIIKKSRSIFTTSRYTRSPKRNNFIAIMADNSFLFIDHIILVQSLNRAFVLGKRMGLYSVKYLMPKPEGEIEFSILSGQTRVIVGLSSQLFAYDTIDITKKCVVAMFNKMTKTFIVRAIANTYESD